jgi:hypothetical protein
MMQRLRHAACSFMLALLPLAAHAQSQSESEKPAVQDLYEKALQSIAEGRKTDASNTLMQVIENEPNHAGAYLEVALIQCGLGRADEAERLFAIIETRFNPNEGILEVISSARDTGCDRWRPVSSSSVMIGRGYDDNVNQGARHPTGLDTDGLELEGLLDEFLPRSDQYTALTADYMRELTPNGSVGFAQLILRRNDTESRFDSTALYAGVEAPYRFGKWTLRATGIGGIVMLGGKIYQRQVQLQARVGPPFQLPDKLQFNVIGGVTHAQYTSLTNFDSDTYEMRGQFTYRAAEVHASASIGFAKDLARSDRPGGDRQGATLNVLLRRPVYGSATGELAYTGQKWRSDLPYSPGVINQIRNQTTHMLRATLMYPLKDNQYLQLEGRMVRNRENISIFQYNNRLIQLSWHYQMP